MLKPCLPWYNRSNYDALYLGLDTAADWVAELYPRATRSERPADLLDRWRDVIGDEIDHMEPAFVSSPAVYPINLEDADELASARSAKRTVASRQEVLAVNLDAPDGVLVEAFRHWLTAARKGNPAPVKQPGRDRLNSTFTPQRFGEWKDRRILDVDDIEAWCEAEEAAGRTRPTNRELGAAIFPNRDQSGKLWIEACSARDEAFAVVRALYQQSVSETP